MIDFLNPPIMVFLEKALNLTTRRQEIIAGNVANLDTPNYTRKDIDFKETLTACINGLKGVKLSQTHNGHLAPDPKKEVHVQDTGEEVELDREMINMAENNLQNSVTTEFVAKKYRGLKDLLEQIK